MKEEKGSEWSDYISNREAIEVYGTTKKKEIDNTLTLIQFFDLGTNKEGYWNYNHIALQVEDMFDVLSIKYPNYDFVLMLDQSSGHGRMREGALNVNQMNKMGWKAIEVEKNYHIGCWDLPSYTKYR